MTCHFLFHTLCQRTSRLVYVTFRSNYYLHGRLNKLKYNRTRYINTCGILTNNGYSVAKLNSHKRKNNLLPPVKRVVPSAHWPISTSAIYLHDEDLKDVPETVRVTFIEKDGTRKEVMGKVGERAMYLAHRKGVDMEGACEASLACTTCHCYIETSDEHWDLLPEATEKEEDLLDMAPFLDVNSRLGCQIIISPELDGIELRLPRATKNFYVDGHKPQPH